MSTPEKRSFRECFRGPFYDGLPEAEAEASA